MPYPRIRLHTSLIALVGLIVMTGCSQIKDTFNNATRSEPNYEAAGAGNVSGFSSFSDVPVPPGTKMDVDSSLVFGSGDEWTGRLTQVTSVNIAKTFDFYQSEMPNFGWTPITMVRSDISILTFVRGDRVATIAMTPRNLGGTKVEFTVAPRGETQGYPSGKRRSDPYADY